MDQATLDTIQRVIKIHAPKYKIPGYEVEDIEQDAFILSLDALKIWDEKVGPFENFLTVFLSTRLISFTRLKLKLNSQSESVQKALLSASDIYSLDWDQQQSLVDKDSVIDNVEIEDIVRRVDEYLPVSLRKDFLKMRAGVTINRGRQKKIVAFVHSLLDSLSGKDRDEEDDN